MYCTTWYLQERAVYRCLSLLLLIGLLLQSFTPLQGREAWDEALLPRPRRCWIRRRCRSGITCFDLSKRRGVLLCRLGGDNHSTGGVARVRLSGRGRDNLHIGQPSLWWVRHQYTQTDGRSFRTAQGCHAPRARWKGNRAAGGRRETGRPTADSARESVRVGVRGQRADLQRGCEAPGTGRLQFLIRLSRCLA